MISSRGGGWQIILADLALILFVVLAVGGETRRTDVPKSQSPTPLAVWRGGEADAGLAAWLAEQAPDGRATLDIRITCPELPALCVDAILHTGSGMAKTPSGRMRIAVVPGVQRQVEARLVYE